MIKKITFVFVLLFVCFGFTPKAEAGYYTTWYDTVNCSYPMNSHSGSTGDAYAEEAYAVFEVVDPMNSAAGDNYGVWRYATQLYVEGCTPSAPAPWGAGELSDAWHYLSLTLTSVDEYGNRWYDFSDWLEWSAVIEHQEYNPTPPGIDVLVNGQSPIQQVAHQGTRPVYGWATGCWRRESIAWTLVLRTNSQFACFGVNYGTFGYMFGQVGTESYTYYKTLRY